MHLSAEYMSEGAIISTRKHARSLFSIPFELRQLAGPSPHPLHAISLDISEGGIGALVQGNLSVGETVQVDLPLAGQTVRVAAIVRHTSVLRSGFEFLQLSDGERRQITKLVGVA